MSPDVFAVVRRARIEDWHSVARLCAETGRQGEPVDADQAAEFAERWVGPYRRLRSDWTFVAEVDRRVVGYLTGCPDSLAFEREVREKLTPTPDSRGFFGERFLEEFWTKHPGHVHMNLAKPYRGQGIGGQLLKQFFTALKAEGVPSAHVFCGKAAFGYWVKAGFSPAASCEPAPGIFIHALTRAV